MQMPPPQPQGCFFRAVRAAGIDGKDRPRPGKRLVFPVCTAVLYFRERTAAGGQKGAQAAVLLHGEIAAQQKDLPHVRPARRQRIIHHLAQPLIRRQALSGHGIHERPHEIHRGKLPLQHLVHTKHVYAQKVVRAHREHDHAGRQLRELVQNVRRPRKKPSIVCIGGVPRA